MTDSSFLQTLRVGFSLVLFGLLFYWVPLGDFAAALSNASYDLVVLAFLLTVLNFGLSTFKLHFALRTLGHSVRFGSVLRAYYIGTFFNNFIPTSIGGDLVKTLELNKIEGIELSDNMLSVVAERLSGILVLLGLGTFFLFRSPQLFRTVGFTFIEQGRIWTVIVALFTLISLLLTWWLTDSDSGSDSWMSNLRDWLHFPREYPTATGLLLGVSALFHGSRAVIFVLLGWAFGVEIPLEISLFVLPIIAFAAFLPISLGGIGLREGIITFCLHAFGVPLDASLGISMILRLFSVIHSTAGGYCYTISPPVDLES